MFAPAAASAELVITEILAVASIDFPDEDGEPSDWIEITNTGASSVPLDGHYLTNAQDNLTRWAFPAGVSIGAGDSLVVYASGKNRIAVPGQLHASFTLDAGGDYVGLIGSDGTTVVSEIAPGYPAQFDGISYGLGEKADTSETFVPFQSMVRYHVQDEDLTDMLGDTWKQPAPTFDDSGWLSAQGALGFESGTSGNLWDVIVTKISGDMKNKNASGLFRFPFDYSAADKSLQSMQLRVTIDDAFVAYLNGTEIGSYGKPDPLTWKSNASTSVARGDEIVVSTPITIDVTAFAGALIDGQNVLAIQGMNTSAGSSDFVVDAELLALVRDTSGTLSFGYMESPTPGLANDKTKTAPPGDIVFSTASTLFTDDFELVLTCPTPGAVIRYTTDLSVPVDTPGDESAQYLGPISIDASTQVRARAFVTGALPGATGTETYLKMSDTLPAISSDLPLVVISTLGGGAPPQSNQTTRKAAYMFVFEPDPATGRTTLTQVPQESSRVGIRKRGQSSGNWPKYSLTIEAWRDGDDEDRNIKPLDFSKEADWILSGRYQFDRALFRNDLIYELSRQVGRYATRSRFVEVYNDVSGELVDESDYFGVYSLMEKIEADRNRVEIENIEPWENTEPAVTGGYVIKHDKLDPDDVVIPVTGFNRGIAPHDPDSKVISAQQRSWLSVHLNEVGPAISAANGTNPSTGKHFSEYIDVDSYIDHHWLNTLTMNVDWGRISAFHYKDRGEVINAGPIWDFDRTMGSEDSRDNVPQAWDGTGDSSKTWYDSRYQWFGDLIGPTSNHANANFPDVRQRHTDRWFEMREGALSTSNINTIIDSMAAEISEAQARNFTKWTQMPPNGGNYAQAGLSGWEAEVSHLKGWLEARVDWIDSQYLPLPVFNTSGGMVANGFGLTMSSSASQIWFTSDGSDPRAPGGTPAAGATLYPGSAVSITTTQLVTARSYSGSQWGAPEKVELVVSDEVASDTNLVVSEIMYRPMQPTLAEETAGFTDRDDFEYIELLNISASQVALLGVAFVDGILFDFNDGPISLLASGERVLVVKNQEAFEMRYGTTYSSRIAGEFLGDTGLSNDGEQVVISAFGAVVRDFTYNDKSPWPEAADGDGFSLVLIAPEENPDHSNAANWRSSAAMGGSPGFSDSSSFATWAANNGGITAGSDGDNDGRDALREYAEGTGPSQADLASMPLGRQSFEVGGVIDEYLTISIPTSLAADDVERIPQVSDSLAVWVDSPEGFVLIEETNNGDGTGRLWFRSALPLDQLPAGTHFVRFHYQLR